ncbi:prolyl oligopeptidase family serine peptidase [Streptomyces sp. NBC_00690]|uniref:prolyl oligopeptidase family serine peptidase n=1 Tax=Streptomyces sp. NBC_00690 TaxID=2975808 RepID=UPI002E2B2DD8|nr:prolyl oligopeptidase family serine peptidase [Streptomyces sp. NBC_00690]
MAPRDSGRRFPPAHRDPTVHRVFGVSTQDPYRWLEDSSSAETRTWEAAQDRLYAAERRTWPHRFGPRLRELYGAASEQVPAWRGDRRFFLRHIPGNEHEVLYTSAPDDLDRPLLDLAHLSDADTITLEAWEPSPDGRLVACQLAYSGSENASLRVLDVRTGGLLADDGITGCRSSPVAWLPDGRSFYYTRPEYGSDGGTAPGARPCLWWHRVGEHTREDVLVLGGQDDHRRVYDVRVSPNGRLLLVSLAAGPALSRELMLADLGSGPASQPRLRTFHPAGRARVRADAGPDGRLYLLTDENAPRHRLCVADPENPRGPWEELIPEDPWAVLARVVPLGGGLLLAQWARDAVHTVTVHRTDTGELIRRVPLPELGTVRGISVHPASEADTPGEAWIAHADMTSPPRIHRYDPRTGLMVGGTPRPSVRSRTAVTTRHVRYRSEDGTSVGMLVLAQDTKPGRPRPLLLTAYGGFGVSMSPSYQPDALAWVEAGGVYAVAQVRGGGEQGQAWHRAGTGAGKQNSIDDFHAAAEWLVDNGWTTPRQLGAVGGSNGGLLVASALVQRPELYGAAVCSAPLLDMLRYERSGMGRLWSAEYGTADDPEHVRWLLSYSPYHNVREETSYPAVLFAVFQGDTRVDPSHARKMCGALQHANRSGRPVLLRREAGSGHGKRSTSRAAALGSDVLAFLGGQLGLKG